MTCQKVIIPEIDIFNTTVSSKPLSDESHLIGSEACNYYYTSVVMGDNIPFYNFPVLLNSNGSLWQDGIRFVFHLMELNDFTKSYFSDANFRKISHIIDFKSWCDSEGINMFDFNHRFALKRPTYLYFQYLTTLSISAENINNRTSTIYEFIKFHSRSYKIDMSRVDQVKESFIQYTTSTGFRQTKLINKRLLTAKKIKRFPNYKSAVMDDGEELRPLTSAQKSELYVALNSPIIDVDERLIFETCLETGARKQTILTIRLKHIKLFTNENLHTDNCFRIQAGLGTDIDTKKDKRLTIVIPLSLAEKLKIYASSTEAKNRRKIFFSKFGDNLFKDKDDIYLFIGKKGNCRYMAKSDPRYARTFTRPKGHSISAVVSRIKKLVSNNFPTSYTFHWNRATYAYDLYLALVPHLNNQEINFNQLIGYIQNSLGHEEPKTTLNYLKLFRDENKQLDMQESWERKFL